jgi:asparagine synthase (glutamine-hydrolysing)
VSGICGILRPDQAVGTDELGRVSAAMASRGDEAHLACAGGAGLAQRTRRFERIAPSVDVRVRGAERRCTVLFDGDIFNRAELVAALAAEGVALRGDSDSELVGALYAAFGPTFARRLRGPFALAILDDESLLLARDALGVRPLFVSVDAGACVFAPRSRRSSRRCRGPRSTSRPCTSARCSATTSWATRRTSAGSSRSGAATSTVWRAAPARSSR